MANQSGILTNALLGWNHCLNNNHLDSLKIIASGKYKIPQYYDDSYSDYYQEKMEQYMQQAWELFARVEADDKNFKVETVEEAYVMCVQPGVDDGYYDLLGQLSPEIRKGINLHADDNLIFHNNLKEDRFRSLLWLYELDHKIDITGDFKLSFIVACKNGYTEMMKWLYEKAGMSKKYDDYSPEKNMRGYLMRVIMYILAENNHLETAKELYKLCSRDGIKIEFFGFGGMNKNEDSFRKAIDVNLDFAKWIFKVYCNERKDRTESELFSHSLSIIGKQQDERIKELYNHSNPEVTKWVHAVYGRYHESYIKKLINK